MENKLNQTKVKNLQSGIIGQPFKDLGKVTQILIASFTAIGVLEQIRHNRKSEAAIVIQDQKSTDVIVPENSKVYEEENNKLSNLIIQLRAQEADAKESVFKLSSVLEKVQHLDQKIALKEIELKDSSSESAKKIQDELEILQQNRSFSIEELKRQSKTLRELYDNNENNPFSEEGSYHSNKIENSDTTALTSFNNTNNKLIGPDYYSFYSDYTKNLSTEQLLAFSTLLFSNIILTSSISIIFIFFGD